MGAVGFPIHTALSARTNPKPRIAAILPPIRIVLLSVTPFSAIQIAITPKGHDATRSHLPRVRCSVTPKPTPAIINAENPLMPPQNGFSLYHGGTSPPPNWDICLIVQELATCGKYIIPTGFAIKSKTSG